MFLSIVIPVYNVEAYISRCLYSCLEIFNYYNDLEIIIVNDGTKDRSIDIAKNIIRPYDKVYIIDKNNGGLSSARNAGLDAAQGDYIWFIDSDDWIVADKILEITKILKEKQPDIFQIQFQLAYDDGRRVYKYRTKLNGLVDKYSALVDSQTPVGAPFSIYNRQFLLKHNLKFYEGIYHEDVEFKPRALFFASKVYYYNQVCYLYYQRISGSITSRLRLKNGLDDMIVAKSLDKFYTENNMSADMKIIFKRKVSASIVAIIKVASQLTCKKEVTQLMQLIMANKNLIIRNMLLSKNIKYILIGFVCLIMPRMNLLLYKVMYNE